MRYRLRTLLIVVTVAGSFFAWAAHVRKMEQFHRTEESKNVNSIALAEKDLWPALAAPRDEHVRARVTGLVEGGPRKNVGFEIRRRDIPGSEDIVIYNSRGLSTRGRGEFDCWKMAVHHRIMADKYRRALFQPWILLWRE